MGRLKIYGSNVLYIFLGIEGEKDSLFHQNDKFFDATKNKLMFVDSSAMLDVTLVPQKI